MDAVEVLDRIYETAVGLGMATSREEILDRKTVIARRSDFKVQWFLTRLHTFVVASAFVGPPTTAELDAFLTAAREYAVAHKGGLPAGLQTGSAAIAIALVPSHLVETEDWATQPHGRRFAAITFPVLADVSSGVVLDPKRMVVGGIYAKHLRSVVHQIVQI